MVQVSEMAVPSPGCYKHYITNYALDKYMVIVLKAQTQLCCKLATVVADDNKICNSK